MKAIQTKLYPGKLYEASRIKVWAHGIKARWIPVRTDKEDNHSHAAEVFAQEQYWAGEWVKGVLDDIQCVFVCNSTIGQLNINN